MKKEKWEGLEFWRCFNCPQVISLWDARKQIKETQKVVCPHCGSHKLRKADLSFLEKCVQIFKHPMVWKWKEVTLNDRPE